ncbi:MAG TPA: GTP 3',8-cyclase MoaA [Clostridiales bacterium UBA8960]|nr:GTP 3',8-cyclase MoaA [Clostridiales bacterium UBA8960]
MIDQYGRTINYLRLSVTDKCNLRCKYCMPEEGIEKVRHDDILTYEEITQVVETMSQMGVDKIRITGGEPLVRPGIVNLVSMLSRLDSVREVTMTTNGILLSGMAEDLKKAGLRRVNISLDSLNPARFKEMTRGGDLSKVIAGIDAAKRHGLTPIKLNVVLINGFNDDEIQDFVALTMDDEIDVRFIELMPIGEVAKWNKSQFVSNKIVLERMPELIPTISKDPSSPATYYKLPGGKGKVGLISPISCKFCDMCNRVRITSEGFLKQCLHSNEEIALRPLIKSIALLEHTLRRTVFEKPEEHQIEEGHVMTRNMVEVGG